MAHVRFRVRVVGLEAAVGWDPPMDEPGVTLKFQPHRLAFEGLRGVVRMQKIGVRYARPSLHVENK